MILAQQIIVQDMTSAMEQIVMGNSALKIAGNNERKTLEQFAQNTGADLESLIALENFTFYVHNKKENLNRKPFLMKSPSFLVNTNSEYYLKKSEKHALLKWLAEESGYYRRSADTPLTQNVIPKGGAVSNEDYPTLSVENKSEPLKPAFDDF